MKKTEIFRRFMRMPLVLIALIELAALALPANALQIQEVVSSGGIHAWLVESRTIPLIAMNFSFKGGAAVDPVGKEGLAHFMTGMMDEGAGNLASEQFQAKADELAMKMSFDTGLDSFDGSFQTLSRNRDPSFALLKLALTSPHFDAEPLERVRGQFVVEARQNQEDPEKHASSAWMSKVFARHPYARDTEGTPQSIGAITPADLHDLHSRLFTRKGLLVSVVGDIDADTLKRLLDETFGALPDHDVEPLPADASVAPGPAIEIIDRPIPQSVVIFGSQGLLRNDRDFIPAYVMSFILGGGGFGSRLTDEVREKRGLTYGVSLGLYPLDHAGLLLGSLSTRNDKVGEAIGVVQSVIRRFVEEGPTASELAEIKTYLTGSYALRFDSNAKIANQLLGIQQDNLGIDYIDKRNAMIEAVTLGEVKAQAKRLLDADRMIITIVGRPQGIKASPGSG